MTDKPRCGAKTRAGTPCKFLAGYKTDHPGFGRCKHHGGAHRNGKKQAQRQQAEQAVATFGLPVDIDPHSALLEELHRTAGAVAWLQQVIRDRGDDQVTHLIEGRDIRLRDQEEPTRFIISETASVYVDLYQRERKHLTEVAKTCIQVGIEERRVRLAEQQGQLLAQVVDRILTDLGVRDRPEVPDVVRRAFTVLDGGLAAS